jgi:Outer membrane protein beta-barrel domain
MPLIRLFLCLVLFIVTNLQAQTNFIKAIIITNTNDSIKGFIDYQKWEAEPAAIAFKNKLSDKKRTILPTEIKGFMVGGDIYETHKVKLEEALKETANEIPLMGFTTSADTLVFFRCHVKGYWNLYSRTTGDGISALYVNKEKDTLQLLTYRKAASVSNGRIDIGMTQGYKRQLLNHFNDYPELSKSIVDAEYKASTIQDIIVNYNKRFSTKEPLKYIATQAKTTFDCHFFAGGNYSFISLISEQSYLSNRRLPDQTIKGHGFDFGVSAQWSSARRLNKVSFVMDLDVKTMRLFNTYNNNIGSIYSQFDNSYLRLYTQARYQFFRSNQVSLFVNGGTVFSYTLKKENDFTSTLASTGGTYNDSVFPKEDFKQYNLGFTAGVMARFSKVLALEIRGETNRGMSPYISVASRLTSVNAFLYYRLY